MASPTTPNTISQLMPSGSMDRSIQILGLTYTTIRGEAVPTYAEVLSISASKEPLGGTEANLAGAMTSLSGVRWRIRYNTEMIIASKNYESMQLAEVIVSPVYLLDLAGQVMYDLFGNPLVSILNTDDTILYDIKDVQEVGRKVGMDLICERWR